MFKKLLGLDPSLIASQADGWLKTLRIEHKVTIQDGEYSTVNLSQGQRKRLALVTAMLEDRPFYVFDEWAADQDPQYKEVFYGELLPELRARGKGVIVVTHDDRYFHVGDRVLKLDEGKIVEASNGIARGRHAAQRSDTQAGCPTVGMKRLVSCLFPLPASLGRTCMSGPATFPTGGRTCGPRCAAFDRRAKPRRSLCLRAGSSSLHPVTWAAAVDSRPLCGGRGQAYSV